MEVIVSIFIFVLMMGAVSEIFTNFVAAYRSAKVLQRNLENAEYAINLMAKNLRTSTIVSGSESLTSIQFYNYSDGGKCISYKIQSYKLQVASVNSADIPGDLEFDKKTWCQGATLSGYSDFTSTDSVYINGLKFYIVPSDGTSNPKTVGKVTLSAEVCSDSVCANKAIVQTSVSLMDYSVSGL